MMDHVTGWLEIKKYNNKRKISIVNLVNTTWLYRHPIAMEIIYYNGSECIGHDFGKS